MRIDFAEKMCDDVCTVLLSRRVCCLARISQSLSACKRILAGCVGVARPLLVSTVLALAVQSGTGFAEEPQILPDNVTFVISTGFWEDSAGQSPDGAASMDQPSSGNAVQKGYYKLIAVRQPEGNAHIHLQQIAGGPDGPRIVSSTELEEFSAMKAYVTDIRPETSDGIAQEPGLFATVYLKTDPQATDSESWTVLIDDIGDIRIERETN